MFSVVLAAVVPDAFVPKADVSVESSAERVKRQGIFGEIIEGIVEGAVEGAILANSPYGIVYSLKKFIAR